MHQCWDPTHHWCSLWYIFGLFHRLTVWIWLSFCSSLFFFSFIMYISHLFSSLHCNDKSSSPQTIPWIREEIWSLRGQVVLWKRLSRSNVMSLKAASLKEPNESNVMSPSDVRLSLISKETPTSNEVSPENLNILLLFCDSSTHVPSRWETRDFTIW